MRTPLVLVVLAAVGVSLVSAPNYLDTEMLFLIQQIVVVLILALSVDLLDGFSGLPSLGQAAFFGVSAYVIAHLVTKSGIESFFLASIAGLVAAGLVAALFGLAALRTTSLYFLLVTFAFGELLATAASQFSWLSTPGVEGMVGVGFTSMAPGIAWTTESVYIFALIACAVCLAGYWILTRSSFGYSLLGMREGKARVRALGVNTWQLSYVVFIVAGLMAGVAGEVKVVTTGAAVPSDFGVFTSAEALLVVLVGGSRKVPGIVAGAIAVVVITYYASLWFPVRWPLIIGTLYFGAAFLALRGGLAGGVATLASRLRGVAGSRS